MLGSTAGHPELNFEYEQTEPYLILHVHNVRVLSIRTSNCRNSYWAQ